MILGPVCRPVLFYCTYLSQFSCYHRTAQALNISVEDLLDYHALSRVHYKTLGGRIIVISKASIESDHLPALHLHLETLLYVGGNVLYFLLGHRTQYREEQFPIHRHRIDVLILKEYCHILFLELAHIVQRIYSISCETGYGLGDDQIDLVCCTIRYHLPEAFPFIHLCSCDSSISVNIHQLPFWIIVYLVGVVLYLGMIAVHLIFRIGAHPAVRGNT